MARLLGVTVRDVQAQRLEVALDAAEQWRAYVVLKGFHTILATPDGRAFVNTTGNPGMATGGTGRRAHRHAGRPHRGIRHQALGAGARPGVYLHGLAGDIAAAHVGEAPLVASDLSKRCPRLLRALVDEWEHACSEFVSSFAGRDRGDRTRAGEAVARRRF